eukprot:Pgem_evm7s16871
MQMRQTKRLDSIAKCRNAGGIIDPKTFACLPKPNATRILYDGLVKKKLDKRKKFTKEDEAVLDRLTEIAAYDTNDVNNARCPEGYRYNKLSGMCDKNKCKFYETKDWDGNCITDFSGMHGFANDLRKIYLF